MFDFLTHQKNDTQLGGYRSHLGVILAGIFVTTLVAPMGLGEIPLKFFLKNNLNLPPSSVSSFVVITSVPFYLKPIAGFIIDKWRLYGTRRRLYLLFSCLLCAVGWIALGTAAHTFAGLATFATLISVTVMAAGTVVGALLVEEAQQKNTTGSYGAARILAMGVSVIAAGGLGGLLAGHPLMLTAYCGALFCCLLSAASPLIQETLPSGIIHQRLGTTAKTMGGIMRSPGVGVLIGIVALVLLAPGFNTVLFYIQLDQLHLSPQFIGVLTILQGAATALGAGLYFLLCRRFQLGHLLMVSLATHGSGTLMYLWYNGPIAAVIIQTTTATISTLVLLAAFDTVTRIAPRGGEATCYAIFISAGNVMYSLSDVLGSWLHDQLHVQFLALILINATTTIMALPFVYRIPRNFLNYREGCVRTPV